MSSICVKGREVLGGKLCFTFISLLYFLYSHMMRIIVGVATLVVWIDAFELMIIQLRAYICKSLIVAPVFDEWKLQSVNKTSV